FGPESSYHPQVDQRKLVIPGDENIAGMRIGVHQPMNQDLVEVRPTQLTRQHLAVHFESDDRTERADLRTRHVFHRQDTRRRVLRDRAWDDDVEIRAQILPEHLQMPCLLEIIEFAEQGATKGLEQVAE